jgi:DNA-binding transcriptional LysR family regulator
MRRFVEEYLERNGVLRQQLQTPIDMNSTEAILSAVEAGLGVGFVPCMALEKALIFGTVKSVVLENGPIKRQLSIVLLNGPEPRGPIAQLMELVRYNTPTQTVGDASGTNISNRPTLAR